MKRVLPFILLILLLFCGCSNSSVNTYVLSHMYLDNEEVNGQTATLSFSDSQDCTLTFNGASSEITVSETSPDIQINDLSGKLERDGEDITITFDDIGLKLVFSHQADTDAVSDNENTEQGQLWTGRMYYSDCSGNFSDYDLSSISLYGTISENAVNLYNAAYSDAVPMISLDYENDECKGGYILDFPIDEYAAEFTRSTENAQDVNNTEFIKAEEYIWNMYNTETEETKTPADMVDVLTITGTVRNLDGGFTYRIVLTPVNG